MAVVSELLIDGPGPTLAGTRDGPAEAPVQAVLMHGLTATRHYTLMGSRYLDRAGIASFAYDARGHGASAPAGGPSDYTYAALAGDLDRVLAELAVTEPVVLHGISMGAHTAVRYALDHPGRVRGLLLITPAHLPGTPSRDRSAWDELADALRGADPIDAFVEASHLDNVDAGIRDQLELAIRQRIGRHEHLAAVADALQGIPRSAPFDALEELAALDVPAIVVGSQDAVDPSHPLAVAEQWTAALPQARLEVEAPGKSPLAWQGGRLARFVEELVGA